MTSGWDHHTIRVAEEDSISRFVNNASLAGFLSGRVLDFGAGKPGTCRIPEPYRRFIIGTYCPYDLGDPEPTGQFDAVLCTQVLQYVRDVPGLLARFASMLRKPGYLVLTYATNWDEVETTDFWRFTKAGMELLLANAGFTVLRHDRRAQVNLGAFNFPLGYGTIARI